MKLSNLSTLYKSLKQKNENYYIFSFTKNKVEFDVLFDIFPNPFQLVFLQRANDFILVLNVEPGFIIDWNLDKETYYKLCQILNLKYDPNNKFSPRVFFEELNNKIPTYKERKIEKRELLKFYKSTIEDKDRLYFKTFIEWNKTENSGNLTTKNLEKTRILYPELYEKCKRENISVRYTAGKENTELLNKNLNR